MTLYLHLLLLLLLLLLPLLLLLLLFLLGGGGLAVLVALGVALGGRRSGTAESAKAAESAGVAETTGAGRHRTLLFPALLLGPEGLDLVVGDLVTRLGSLLGGHLDNVVRIEGIACSGLREESEKKKRKWSTRKK